MEEMNAFTCVQDTYHLCFKAYRVHLTTLTGSSTRLAPLVNRLLFDLPFLTTLNRLALVHFQETDLYLHTKF